MKNNQREEMIKDAIGKILCEMDASIDDICGQMKDMEEHIRQKNALLDYLIIKKILLARTIAGYRTLLHDMADIMLEESNENH